MTVMMMVMMSILTSAPLLCFLLLPIHIFLTFHLPSSCSFLPYLTIHYHHPLPLYQRQEKAQEEKRLRF